MIAFIQNYEYEGDNNVERRFIAVLVLGSALLDRCLQQIAPSCENNLKLFLPKFEVCS